MLGWGDCNDGQCDVPAPPPGTSYVDIAAGAYHTVALRSDGLVVAWGRNDRGQCTVPALPPGETYIEVAAGDFHSVARRSDGALVAWGDNAEGQSDPPAMPAGTRILAIAASWQTTVALRGPMPARNYTRFATGCPGSLPTAHLVPNAPRVGTVLQVTLAPLPQDAAFLFTGLIRTVCSLGPLPLDLAPYGMPGCTGRASDEAGALLSGAGGPASYQVAIPNSAALVGLQFYQQALVPDAASGNRLGATMSDAMAGVIVL